MNILEDMCVMIVVERYGTSSIDVCGCLFIAYNTFICSCKFSKSELCLSRFHSKQTRGFLRGDKPIAASQLPAKSQARIRQLNEELHEYCTLSFDEAMPHMPHREGRCKKNIGTQETTGEGKMFEKCSRL